MSLEIDKRERGRNTESIENAQRDLSRRRKVKRGKEREGREAIKQVAFQASPRGNVVCEGGENDGEIQNVHGLTERRTAARRSRLL